MTSKVILWPRMHAVPAPARRNPVLSACSLYLVYLLITQLSFAGESPYTGPGSGSLHYYCSSDPAQGTIFFSSAFDAASGTKSAKVSDGFKQSLADEYAYEGDVYCFGNFKTLDAAQAGDKKRVTDLRSANKAKVVETGWAFGSAAGTVGSAPAAASTPAASANPLAAPAAQPAVTPQAQSAPAPNTTLAVRMLEELDSSKY